MRDAIHRRRWRDDEGMSLVELMIAVFVLSVGLLALASTAITSIISLRVSQGRQEATDAASALIEDLRRTDYALVALDATDPDVTALGGCEPSFDEPIVTTSQPGAIPHSQTFGPSGRVTLTTTVSWYDEDENGPQTCTDATHDQRVKRVQVVAEWTDGDRTFSLDESTLVAPVDRGLPAPDFRLGTPEVDVFFTPDDISTKRERCVGHVLRNLGAQDGYEWTAIRTDSGSVEKSNAARYWTADGRFYLRAFLENPAEDPPHDPADHNVPKDQVDRHANLPAGLELMVDGTDANAWPESGSTLAAGDQARLWICYWLGSNASLGDKAEFEIIVSSQFDPNRTESVAHTVKITNEILDLHLYDDDESNDGASSTRALTRPNGTQYLPTLPMGPQTTLQPDRLGTSSLPNYDTDFDTLPGTGLASTSTHPSANTIVFHEQITRDRVFANFIDVQVWTASREAVAAGQAGATSVTPQRLNYNFRLQVLDKNENHVQSTPLPDSTVLSYDHTSVGWEVKTFRITLPSSFSVRKDEYVQLAITCNYGALTNPTTDTCQLAYDNTAYPALIKLAVKS